MNVCLVKLSKLQLQLHYPESKQRNGGRAKVVPSSGVHPTAPEEIQGHAIWQHGYLMALIG